LVQHEADPDGQEGAWDAHDGRCHVHANQGKWPNYGVLLDPTHEGDEGSLHVFSVNDAQNNAYKDEDNDKGSQKP